jgi:hypothetical protein
MTVDAWLRLAIADADQRGLPELRPLLEGFARATDALRHAGILTEETVFESSTALSDSVDSRESDPR